MAQTSAANQLERVTSPPLVVLASSRDSRWELCVDQIDPVRGDIRQRYEDAALDALAASIRTWGQLQPIIVRRVGGRYQVICGERRWRAMQRAGLPRVWAIEQSASDVQALALRLAENLHHLTLSHAEKVAALDQLSELVGSAGLRETARQLGMDPSWLSRQLAIRKDPILFAALERGQIGFGQAAELRRAPVDQLPALLERVVSSESRISTGTIRSWVLQARQARKQPADHATSRVDVRAPGSGFAAILQKIRVLGAPSTAHERLALEQIACIARELLSTEIPDSCQTYTTVSGKTSRAEVWCLLCGELAGLRDARGVLEVTSTAGVQRRRGQAICGRCGGALTIGALDVKYHY